MVEAGSVATVIEALSEYTGPGPSLFLAGGITGCPPWQDEALARLAGLPLVLLNPRRRNFPMNDPNAAEEQIAWEHRHLRRATAVMFWFPAETLAPITLYELGAVTVMGKPLFAGTHPDYGRRQDVRIQTRLARPEVVVADSLAEVCRQVGEWCQRVVTA